MNKKIYKCLLLIFFVLTFMLLNIDVKATKSEDYKNRCIYNYKDKKGKNGIVSVYPANDKTTDLSIDDIEFEGGGKGNHTIVLGEAKSRESGLFIVENNKLYCPDIAWLCYDGSTNFIAKNVAQCDATPAKLTIDSARTIGIARQYKASEDSNTYDLIACSKGGADKATNINRNLSLLITKINSLDNIITITAQKSYFELKGYVEDINDSQGISGYCDSEGIIDILEKLYNTKAILDQKVSSSTKISMDEKKDIREKYQQKLNDLLRDTLESNTIIKPNVPFNEDEISCNDLIDDDLKAIIQLALKILRIAAPIILIVLVMVDFSVAVISNDNDATKKATSKAIKRAIAALVLFFIPLLVSVMIDWIDESEYFNPEKVNCNDILKEGDSQ